MILTPNFERLGKMQTILNKEDLFELKFVKYKPGTTPKLPPDTNETQCLEYSFITIGKGVINLEVTTWRKRTESYRKYGRRRTRVKWKRFSTASIKILKFLLFKRWGYRDSYPEKINTDEPWISFTLDGGEKYNIIRPKRCAYWKESIIRINNSVLAEKQETIVEEYRQTPEGKADMAKIQKYIDGRKEKRKKGWDPDGTDGDNPMNNLRLPDNPMNLRL